ncbi:hypothetical protein [Devosia salina]|uniref:Uncharacterized protein n=1 Tax=Devosia salina TaxID=2860336 RepID=A0ABX8WDV1_9HYPH|nr:hypothetical protein [Devosia salina]QYO75617.1 hypothetical protein K1X15_13355 [Devosia salina]
MTQTPVTPPPFAGLVWTDLQAPANERFWELYRFPGGEGKRTLGLAGITARKLEDAWTVSFNPTVAGDKAADIVSTLELLVFAARRKTDDAIAETARRNREMQREQDQDRELRADIARRKLVDHFGDQTDTDLISAAQAAGRACWQKWHNFCVNKRKMAEFTNVDARISLAQAVWLTELVDQTARKAEHLRDNLTASDNAVDWPDDQVVSAVESLCWADHDQAREENGEGWSKADSSKGHWCHGMIKSGGANRSIGIDAARAIVGKYSRQLEKGAA